MSKMDIKNYLTSIYKLDVARVNTRIQHGKVIFLVRVLLLPGVVKTNLIDHSLNGAFQDQYKQTF